MSTEHANPHCGFWRCMKPTRPWLMRKSSGENEKFWRNCSKLKDWDDVWSKSFALNVFRCVDLDQFQEVAQCLFYLFQIFLTGIDLSHLLATANIVKHSVDNRRMLLNACVPPLPHLTSDLLQRLTFITCESISARFHESRFCNPDCTHATPPSLPSPMCGSQAREGGGHCGHCVPHNPLFSWLDWHRFLEASRTSGGQKRFHNSRQCSTGG